MQKRENILIEALPYIREFYDSMMVIKMGGHAIVDPEIMELIVQDIVLLKFVGIHPVIVHGGGPEITEKMERMGKKPEFVAGLRVTDDETLEIARMVLVGNVNSKIVSLISKHGGKGIGLSGLCDESAPVLGCSLERRSMTLGFEPDSASASVQRLAC